MRKYLLSLFVCLAVCSTARGQTTPVTTLTASGTSCVSPTAGSVLIVAVGPNYGSASFTINANAGGNTITFYASGDGGKTYSTLSVTPSNSTTTVTSTSTTTAGTVFRAAVSGYTHVCMLMSTQASGNTNVVIYPAFPSASLGVGGGGGGLSGMTAGQVPIAATASTVTSSAPIQGTDTSLMSAGTVSGTSASLCTDANGGATTTGCQALPAASSPGGTPNNGKAFYATNYGVLADGYSVSDASITSGSPNISCPNSDCQFLTTAKVGQRVYITSTCTGSTSNPLPLGATTILSITDANHMVANANSGATVTGTGCLVYGDVDQSTTQTGAWQNLMTAVGAQLLIGPATIYLPCGISLVEGPIEFVAETTHFPPGVIGCTQGSTLINPTPNFSRNSVTGGMFWDKLMINNAQGQMIMRDYEIWGAGISAAGNCPSPSIIGTVVPANAYAQNVIVNAWCGGVLQAGISYAGFQCINCQTDFAGGFTWNAFGQPSTCMGCFGGDAGYGLKLAGTGVADSIASTWQGAGSCGNAVDISSATAVLNEYGDSISGGMNLGGLAAFVNIFGGNVILNNCSSSHGAIDFGAGSTGTVTLNGHVAIQPTGTTTQTFSGTGIVITDSTSPLTVGATDLAPATITFQGQGVYNGVGTGTCSSSTTVFLNPLSATTSLCTNTTATTVLFTAPFTGTLTNLVCTATTGGVGAGSGVVTVRSAPLSTGTFASSTITATFGTGTTASDVTHTLALTAGQPAQIQMTTAGSETLAGVECSVLLHR